ncbi:hypothetical protein [Hyphococcus sp.]|uniref:hypothetical protein n=1 Tax=Hyphococcus sp. TaxID=2038636 RepID=UPI003CCC15A9
MKNMIAITSILTALTGAASANDTMDEMIGASVTYTYADGTKVVAQYNADGTYTTDSLGGGQWTIDGDELCITTQSGDTGCTMLESGRAAGDSWEATDAFGNPVTIAIN